MRREVMFGIENYLSYPFAITEINEDKSSVIAPARQCGMPAQTSS